MAVNVARLEAVLTARTEQFDRAMNKSEGRMHNIGRVAGMAGLAIAGGLAVGLEKSIRAALDAQVSQRRLEQAFKNAHLSAKLYEGQLGKTEAAGRKLGFTDEMQKEALGSLLTATHNYRKSVSELSVAEDISRFKHVGLTDATKMLTMAQTGSQRAAKQLGITIPSVTAAYDALGKNASIAGKAHAKLIDKMATGNAIIDAVSTHVHGQADAFSKTAQGGMEQFHAQLLHIEVAIGTKLLPVLNYLIAEANKLMIWFEANWPRISAVVQRVMDRLRPIIEPMLKNMVLWFHVFADVIQGHWSKAWDAIKQIVVNALDGMKAALGLAWDGFKAVAARLGEGILLGLRNGLAGIGNLVMNHVINPFIDTVSGAWKSVKNAITGLFGKVIDWVRGVLGIGSPSTVFHEIGQNVVHGFVRGIGSMAGVLKNAVVRMVKDAEHFLGIGTPTIPIDQFHKTFGRGHASGGHLVPQVLHALDYARSQGWQGTVTSGYRSYAEQAHLYDLYKNHGGNIAAPPGHSSHETGQAIDVTDWQTFGAIMAHAPGFERLYSRVPNDPVHFSVSGYDQGGWLPPGLSLALNATGRPERVLPPGGGGDVNVYITNQGVIGSREQALAWFQNAAQVFQRRNNRPAFGV